MTCLRPIVTVAALGLATAATAQTVPSPSPVVTVVPPAPVAPVEHRLTPDEIAAAQADGAERNRAAELLATSRGAADLTLPAERKKPQVHGQAGVAFGTGGYREAFGSETTTLSDGTTIGVAGDYAQFGRARPGPR